MDTTPTVDGNFPEDVLAIARRIAATLNAVRDAYADDAAADMIRARYDELKSQGLDFGACSEIASAEFIAQAILAERERCASVAEQRFTSDNVVRNKKGEPYLTGSAAIYAARRIAAAIRSGN